jgi:hypothetical protein
MSTRTRADALPHEKREPRQRRRREIKSCATISLEVFLQPATLFVRTQHAQVLFVHRERNVGQHFLHRHIYVLPSKYGAEGRMATDQLLPRAREGPYVHGVERARDLLDVDACAWIAQPVEQHSLLHRRQRIAGHYR